MLTQSQKQKYHSLLVSDQTRLSNELRRVQANLAEEHPGYSTHMADDASDVFEQEKALSLRRNIERDLEMINAALFKLDNDEFGICERCGDSINPDRLDALPHVRYCLACQKHLEARYP